MLFYYIFSLLYLSSRNADIGNIRPEIKIKIILSNLGMFLPHYLTRNKKEGKKNKFSKDKIAMSNLTNY